VLLPASIIGALLLVAQGVPQNLKAYNHGPSARAAWATQTFAQGQWPRRKSSRMGTKRRRILQRQTSGPSLRETPRRSRNLYEMFLDLSIGAGLTYTLAA